MTSAASDAPTWFTEALAAPTSTGAVVVEGAQIRFRAWGQAGAPGLVLVHGGAAHSRWWDHIGPLLADGRRVVALDLSGHGDSDTRDHYSLALWADEVLAVAAAAGIDGPPVLIGHSMGGMVAFLAAHRAGPALAGVQVIDSPIYARTPEEDAARRQAAFGPKKVYPDRDGALARFRLVPPQDTTLPYVLTHIAETSLGAVDGGWSWKFDASMFGRDGSTDLGAGHPDCRMAFFRSERGIIPAGTLAEMRTRFGPAALVVELPTAGHHPMIDQPLVLVTAIRTTLAAWAADA
ncbi:alpha/beta fold hydrolase [Rhodococcus kronopolitis]|uniref:Alpha/beta fold hydrolase n=1 Tax=Rhodococcus kronopolitis TaxID=1460226 RepID=A0ABV9FWF4_9NOCA